MVVCVTRRHTVECQQTEHSLPLKPIDTNLLNLLLVVKGKN